MATVQCMMFTLGVLAAQLQDPVRLSSWQPAMKPPTGVVISSRGTAPHAGMVLPNLAFNAVPWQSRSAELTIAAANRDAVSCSCAIHSRGKVSSGMFAERLSIFGFFRCGKSPCTTKMSVRKSFLLSVFFVRLCFSKCSGNGPVAVPITDVLIESGNTIRGALVTVGSPAQNLSWIPQM